MVINMFVESICSTSFKITILLSAIFFLKIIALVFDITLSPRRRFGPQAKLGGVDYYNPTQCQFGSPIIIIEDYNCFNHQSTTMKPILVHSLAIMNTIWRAFFTIVNPQLTL